MDVHDDTSKTLAEIINLLEGDFMFTKRLLRRNYFEDLEIEIFKTSIDVINRVKISKDNRRIYAFVLDGDDDYGSIVFALNNETLLDERINNVYQNYSEYEIGGLSGLKYNPGDFCIRYTPDNFSNCLSHLLSEYYSSVVDADIKFSKEFAGYRNRFVSTLVSVVNRLKTHFVELDITEYFIAYVTLHDKGNETILSLMKQTVSEDLINKNFPEIKGYNFYLQQVYKLAKEDQVNHWIKVYLDFMNDRISPDIQMLLSLKKSRFDAKAEIVKLGAVASNILVELVLEYGKYPEDRFEWIIPMKERLKLMRNWTEDDKKIYKSRTLEGELCVDFAIMIKDIAILDDHNIRNLHELLASLFNQNKSFRRNGLNIPVLARTLHTIDPITYPEAIIGSGDNKLMNYKEFGLE